MPSIATATIRRPTANLFRVCCFLRTTEASGATSYFSRDLLNDALGGSEDGGHSDEQGPLLKAAHPVLTDPEQGFYVRCDPLNGRAIVGRRGRDGFTLLDDPDEPDEPDDSVGDDFCAWAREKVESRLPRYVDVHDVGMECGLYTMSPDNQPGNLPVGSESTEDMLSTFNKSTSS